MKFSIWPLAKHLADLRHRHPLCTSSPRDPSIVLLYHDISISESQCFPFHYYRKSISSEFGASVRLVSLKAFKAVEARVDAQCRLVLFQTWFDVQFSEIDTIATKIRSTYPNARIGYMDCFAPLDLRLAGALNPHIDFYIKKHFFKDIQEYSRPLFGDTNLEDFYGKRYGLEFKVVNHELPAQFVDKIMLGPQFFTAEYLTRRIVKGMPKGTRIHDLHARIGVKGTPWYQRMRSEAKSAVLALKGVSVVTDGLVSNAKYLREIGASRMTFSPFGYGEVCWRDYEAVAYGSLLLKPDMSHIRTDPDIFVPYETYVPLAWDFSDLQEKCSYYLQHPDEMARITSNAFAVLHRYITDGGFIRQMRPILAPGAA